MELHEQKKANKAALSKAVAELTKAKVRWKKAWAEKGKDLRAAYEAVVEAGNDVAYLDFQRYLLEKN